MMRTSWLIIAGACLAACGGSSSETPWPVEPEGTSLGPSGEAAPVGGDTDEPADAGAPGAARRARRDAGPGPANRW